jgi:hypothetical protein
MKKITLIFTIATVCSAMTFAQSFTALYSFDSVKTTSGLIDPTAVPTPIGVTCGSFSATGASTNPNAAGRFSFTGWPLGATSTNDIYASLTGSINTSEYYEVTVTPTAGFTMTLSSITFKSQRSGSGIRTYSVRSNADSYVTNLSASISPANPRLSVQAGDIFYWKYDSINTTGQNGSKITLTGADFTNSTSAKTFRFYGWNAELSGGTFSIDTVKISGSVTGATSINAYAPEIGVSVYPNPTSTGIFTINTGNQSTKTVITVFNIIGKVVFSKEVNSTTKEIIDLSNQANGSYFVNVKNDSGSSTKKITINK